MSTSPGTSALAGELPAKPASAPAPRGDFGVMRKLLPYVWEWRGRVALALAFLVAAKLANIGVPLVLKRLVDALSGPKRACWWCRWRCCVAYGALRLSITLFTELREFLFFARSPQRAARRISLEAFEHLLALSACAFTSSARPAASRATSSAARARSSRCSPTRSTTSCRRWSRSRWCIVLPRRPSSTAGSRAITFGALVIYIALHGHRDRVAHRHSAAP